VAVIALAVPMALKQIGLSDEIVVLAFGLLLGARCWGWRWPSASRSASAAGARPRT
jgi:hypothetical protein